MTFEAYLTAAGNAASLIHPRLDDPYLIHTILAVEDEQIERMAQDADQLAGKPVVKTENGSDSEMEHLMVPVGNRAVRLRQIDPGGEILFLKQTDDAILEGDVDIIEPDAPIRAQYRLEAGRLFRSYSMRPGPLVPVEPGHDDPVCPMRDVLRAPSIRIVQGTNRRT